MLCPPRGYLQKPDAPAGTTVKGPCWQRESFQKEELPAINRDRERAVWVCTLYSQAKRAVRDARRAARSLAPLQELSTGFRRAI